MFPQQQALASRARGGGGYRSLKGSGTVFGVPVPTHFNPFGAGSTAFDVPMRTGFVRSYEPYQYRYSYPFGDITGYSSTVIRAVQTALNNSYSPSGMVLTVDGIVGPQTTARVKEFQAFLGYPATGVIDNTVLTALGLNASGGSGGGYSLVDYLTLKPLRDALPSLSAPTVSAPYYDPTLDVNYVSGGDPRQLPTYTPVPASAYAQPTLTNKLAGSLNVSPSTAQMILLGGGAIAVIALLSAVKSRR